MKRDDAWALAIVIVLVLWAATCFAGFPGEQTPGPRLADDPDQLTWTWQQHTWQLIHQFADAIVPVLALALAGAGGAFFHKRKKTT